MYVHVKSFACSHTAALWPRGRAAGCSMQRRPACSCKGFWAPMSILHSHSLYLSALLLLATSPAVLIYQLYGRCCQSLSDHLRTESVQDQWAMNHWIPFLPQNQSGASQTEVAGHSDRAHPLSCPRFEFIGGLCSLPVARTPYHWFP